MVIRSEFYDGVLRSRVQFCVFGIFLWAEPGLWQAQAR
jgi:hypothetical protein